MRASRFALCIGAGLLGVAALTAPIQSLIAGNREDARPIVARALAALAKGDPRAARVELMNAIRADPTWPVARIAQARVLLTLGDGAGALAEMERARALGAAPGPTRHLMAHALLLTGDAKAALAEAQARDIIPQQAAYAARIEALALQKEGRMVEAAAAFDRARAAAPQDPATWIDISRFRRATGDRAAALLASDRAMALAPKNPIALTLRAELIRDQYGAVASLPWFDRALAIDPNHVPAMVEYAATLADMGQAQRMLSLTRRIIVLDRGNPRAFFMQAVMAARAGDMALARRMLGKVGDRLDDQPATMLLRGVLYLDGGNATLAADQFGALVRRQPFNMEARLLYARALHDADQEADADAILTPLAARPDADSYVLTLAGRVREALGDVRTAEALLARASRPDANPAALLPLDQDIPQLTATANADPRVAGPNISYVRVLMARGQIDAAIARARILCDANRGAPEAHVALGDALAMANRWRDAAISYAAASNLLYSQETALRLTNAWNRAGDPALAEQALTLYLNQNPGSIAANRLAATAWMRAGDWKRATAALEFVRARIGNRDAYLLTDLAWAGLGQGDTRRALTYASHAYRLLPASPVTSDAYGWMLFKAKGANRSSVDLLEKAVSLAPGNALLKAHLRAAAVIA